MIKGATPEELAKIVQELSELARDAKRYRYLRDELIEYKPAGYDGYNKGRFDLYWESQCKDLDAAIDAQMIGEKS